MNTVLVHKLYYIFVFVYILLLEMCVLARIVRLRWLIDIIVGKLLGHWGTQN